MPTAAALYCRISHDPGATQLGVGRQEKDCRKVADEKGWPVAAVLVDNDLSASKASVRRPAYEELLDGLAHGRFDAVIVWDLDRLTRRPAELERFFEVCDHAKVNHLATVGGDVDLATGEGILVARIKGAVAAEEVRKLRQRVKRKNLERAERGLPASGGHRPFGFAPNRIDHDPVEAAAIRRAAAGVLAGASLADLAREMTADGLSASKFRDGVQPEQLSKLLRQPRLAGLRVHLGRTFGDAVWEPILDRVTWERVVRELDRKHPYAKRAPRHLLTGLATCGECGHHLTAQKRRPNDHQGVHIYNCRTQRGGCGHVSVLGPHLEATVESTVLGWLTGDQLAGGINRLLASGGEADLDRVLDQVAADEALLDDLAGMLGTGQLTRSEWLAARDPIQQRLVAARARLAAARTRRPATRQATAGEIADAWEHLEPDERRSVYDLVIGRLVVARAPHGGRYLPDRVTIEPAFGPG